MTADNDERKPTRADVMRNEPIPLPLADGPGPYRLPKCSFASGRIPESNKAELVLESQTATLISLFDRLDRA